MKMNSEVSPKNRSSAPPIYDARNGLLTNDFLNHLLTDIKIIYLNDTRR